MRENEIKEFVTFLDNGSKKEAQIFGYTEKESTDNDNKSVFGSKTKKLDKSELMVRVI